MTFVSGYGIIRFMVLSGEELATIVEAVLAAGKYRPVCPDTVRRIAADELIRRGNVRAAIKATKGRLHQVYAAFGRGLDYGQAYQKLEAAYGSGSPQAVQATCRELLQSHTSTGERLSILDTFYGGIWAVTGAPRALLDLGCGLNPLTLPWMGLPPAGRYLAYDIDAERIAFLDRYFALTETSSRAVWQDVLCHPPQDEADVALLLKTSASLERQERGSTLRLMQASQSRFVVVSFSVKSLAGRQKGMLGHYEREFGASLVGQPWQVTRLTFETELVFVVEK